MVAALDAGSLAERDDRPHAPVFAPVVDAGHVIALVERGRLDGEPALARRVDQRQRVDRLVVAGSADVPHRGKVGGGTDGHVDLVAVEPAALARRDGGAVTQEASGFASGA